MRETPARFERRTGARYAPPSWLVAEARPLRAREACPTLFRYPGPEGLRDLLDGTLRRLAPEGHPTVWLAAHPGGERARAVRLFGAVAILEPLGLSPCATRRRGIYLGLNRRQAGRAPLVWVPPSALRAPLSWDRIASAEQAERRLGRSYADERARTRESLAAYLEEIDGLDRAGVTRPDRAWLAVSQGDRRALLAEAGLSPRWS